MFALIFSKRFLIAALTIATVSAGAAIASSGRVIAASVDVDLSVLDDGGTVASGNPSGLKMPDATMPRSRYLGPPVKVTLPEPVVVRQPAPEPEPMPAAIVEAPEPAAIPEPEIVSVTETSSDEPAEVVSGDATDATMPPAPPEPAMLEPETEIAAVKTADTSAPEPVDDTATSAASEPAASETASLSPATDGGVVSIVFDAEVTRLPGTANDDLDKVAALANADGSLRVQLRAYADGETLTASKARRLSLSRALSVRSYLIEQGVRSTRIDVRALGNKVEGDPVNRVDIDLRAQ